MKRYSLPVACLIICGVVLVAALPLPVSAQGGPFPLPAELYILTSEGVIIRVDPASGGQSVISPEDQTIADFAISPDGGWYAYRTAADGMVIVSQINGGSGYVLEFSDSAPVLPGSSGPTMAWSPDAARLAYLVPEGVRIAELGAGEFGEAQFSLVRGAWTSLRWLGPDALITVDGGGRYTRIKPIAGQQGQWLVETLPDEPERPLLAVEAALTAQGVTLADGRVVLGTAGAIGFDWGPAAPPLVNGTSLPAPLYFRAPDAAGIVQVWRLPPDGASPIALTAEPIAVDAYALGPGAGQLAFISANRLYTANVDGTNRCELALLGLTYVPPRPAWSPDGTQLAYYDAQGVWVVPADGSQPPRRLIQNVTGDVENTRTYFEPRWSSDGTRLLMGIGFYEGAILGIIDVQTGAVTDLPGGLAGRGSWTNDGRVLTWGWSWGYETPGLFLLDPAAPDAPPVTVLEATTPVADVAGGPDGRWYVLAGVSAQMGPQFVRVLVADSPAGPFAPLYDPGVGGFADLPQLGLPVSGATGPVMMAGLYRMAYDNRGQAAGELVVVDMSNGARVRIGTAGLVTDVQWGR